MYYFIYKTINIINGKYYVGKHQTCDVNDGYVGSGTLLKRAIAKHGPLNFTREILEYFHDIEALNEAEQRYVNIDVVLDPNSYNITLGGHGGFYHINNSIESKKAANIKRKAWWDSLDEQQKHVIREKRSNKGELNGMYGTHRSGHENPMFGKKHSDESRKIMSEKAIGRDMKWSTRKKISDAMKNRWKNDIDYIEKMKGVKRIPPSPKGKKWWNDGVISIRSVNPPGVPFVRGRVK